MFAASALRFATSWVVNVRKRQLNSLRRHYPDQVLRVAGPGTPARRPYSEPKCELECSQPLSPVPPGSPELNG